MYSHSKGSHEFIRAFDLFLKLNGKVVIAALGPFVNLAILLLRGGNGLLPLFFFLYSQSTNEPSYQKSG